MPKSLKTLTLTVCMTIQTQNDQECHVSKRGIRWMADLSRPILEFIKASTLCAFFEAIETN